METVEGVIMALVPEPKFDTPPKVDKVVGIITLVLAVLGISAIIYWQLAAHFGWWPIS